jgi:hypothetical protein
MLYDAFFAGMVTRVLHWNTKFMQFPRAGEARIACEVTLARNGASKLSQVQSESQSYWDGGWSMH